MAVVKVPATRPRKLLRLRLEGTDDTIDSVGSCQIFYACTLFGANGLCPPDAKGKIDFTAGFASRKPRKVV
jgi:hypothetical protein